MRARSVAGLLFVGVIWGSEWVFARALDVPPLAALALRYAIATLALVAIIFIRRLEVPGRRMLLLAAVTGVTFSALPAVLVDWASGRVSPGMLVVVLAMTPLIAALLEGRASGALLVAVIGGVAGTALVAAQGLSFAVTQTFGAAAVLAAVSSIAASVVWMKRNFAAVPVVVLAAIQLGTGALCLAFWSLVHNGRGAFAMGRTSIVVESLLALFGSALALPIYYWLLRQVDSFQLTGTQWIVTAVGVGEGLLLVRETPGWRMAAGGTMLLASFGALLKAKPDDDAPVTLESTLPLSKK